MQASKNLKIFTRFFVLCLMAMLVEFLIFFFTLSIDEYQIKILMFSTLMLGISPFLCWGLYIFLIHTSNLLLQSIRAIFKTFKILFHRGKKYHHRRIMNRKVVTILLTVVLIAVIGVGGYFYLKKLTQTFKKESRSNQTNKEHQSVNLEESNKSDEARPFNLSMEKSSLHGGFWITRGSGASEVVRGGNIFLLRGEIKTEYVISLLESLEKSLSEDATFCSQQARSSTYFSSILSKNATIYSQAASAAKIYQSHESVHLLNIYDLIRSDNSDIFGDTLTLSSIEEDNHWPQIVKSTLVAKTQTDIDGKYQFPSLEPGKYVIFSVWESSLNYVEWCIGLNLEPGQTYKIDIHNDNATKILSKQD